MKPVRVNDMKNTINTIIWLLEQLSPQFEEDKINIQKAIKLLKNLL